MNKTIKKEDKTQDLLSCILQNKADQAIAILDSDNYNKDILKDVGAFINPLPLYQLTVCQAILLDSNDWNVDVVPTVERNRKECDKLLKYWADKFHYPVGEKMDFMPYEDEFGEFSGRPFEAIFGREEGELEEQGCNPDEVLLCYGVLIHDTPMLKEQFSKKTNPDVNIPKKVESGPYANAEVSYNALHACESIISHVFDDLDFIMFWEPNDYLIHVDAQDIRNLVEGAAYTRLLKELKTLTSNK